MPARTWLIISSGWIFARAARPTGRVASLKRMKVWVQIPCRPQGDRVPHARVLPFKTRKARRVNITRDRFLSCSPEYVRPPRYFAISYTRGKPEHRLGAGFA